MILAIIRLFIILSIFGAFWKLMYDGIVVAVDCDDVGEHVIAIVISFISTLVSVVFITVIGALLWNIVQ